MPPLPMRSVVDARDTELKSKKHLGSTSKTLIGDELDKDCRHLETYVCLEEMHIQSVDIRSREQIDFLRTQIHNTMISYSLTHCCA